MPDRSLRLLTFPPRPAQGGERGPALLRERPAAPSEAPTGGRDGDGRGGEQQDENPFAPPPEGTPDQPWRPRHPEGPGPGGDSSWGSRWSDRQPGRSPGGFGERPGGGPEGPGGPGGRQDRNGPGPRWDPADPVQRRARYALLSGIWAVFFALFSWPYVALLLGALALYWGISALRAKPRPPAPDAPAATSAPAAAPAGRSHTTAAISGLVTACLALVLVGTTFTVQLVYRDYYTCAGDALTHEAKQSCERLLPAELRGVLSVGDG
ncbi:hypothetical protein QQY24_12105 [Streptomyces sp. TG1A-8]|uniref:hypothetical protein n=1 Tax=Streptomyces sp. TG1A-8 TaxID=3051385 RepID=UPI00265C383A|nr:hypothetical protein [Streptomyces sp. TG1A-8]MDO0926132.1 hypothetical protein [Streptomyces sp. TG1A-8]